MKYRRLGRTNLIVSEVSLGTVELGMNYGIPIDNNHIRPMEDDASRLLNCALDLGINFIDTARSYGTSEKVIGNTFGYYSRNKCIIATKVHHFQGEHRSGKALYEHIETSVEESLRALRRGFIDILYAHSIPVEIIKRGEVTRILSDLQRRGFVRFIGVTTYGEEAALAAIHDGRYDVIQVAYNPIDRLMEDHVMSEAQAHDIGIVVRSVLQRGAITSRYHQMPESLSELRKTIGKLDKLCDDYNIGSLPELAFRFVLRNQTIASALVGTARMNELEEVIDYSERGWLLPFLVDSIKQINLQDRDQLMLKGWSV